MRPGSGPADDVLHTNSANQHSIRYKRTVTSPWHCLGAHQSARFQSGEFDGAFDPLCKFRSLHVIGESTEACVVPPQVDRIGPRMTQSPELLQMDVSDPCGTQGRRQSLAVELRIVARFRYGADVDHALNAIRTKQPDEFVKRPRGMANRVDCQFRFIAPRRHRTLLHLICTAAGERPENSSAAAPVWR